MTDVSKPKQPMFCSFGSDHPSGGCHKAALFWNPDTGFGCCFGHTPTFNAEMSDSLKLTDYGKDKLI